MHVQPLHRFLRASCSLETTARRHGPWSTPGGDGWSTQPGDGWYTPPGYARSTRPGCARSILGRLLTLAPHSSLQHALHRLVRRPTQRRSSTIRPHLGVGVDNIHLVPRTLHPASLLPELVWFAPPASHGGGGCPSSYCVSWRGLSLAPCGDFSVALDMGTLKAPMDTKTPGWPPALVHHMG